MTSRRVKRIARRQDNNRGMGLARDVKAGQADENPYSRARKRARRRLNPRYNSRNRVNDA